MVNQALQPANSMRQHKMKKSSVYQRFLNYVFYSQVSVLSHP